MSEDEIASTSSSTCNENKKELCVFYVKVGSCRHGSKCSRTHVRPKSSKTILLRNFFPEFVSPNKGVTLLLKNGNDSKFKIQANYEQKHLEEFYSEVFLEIYENYGKIRELHICQNISDHMRGNVYVMFQSEANASAALEALNNRWFAGKPICAQFSPVSDFCGPAVCRQFKFGNCDRGNFCNFLHLCSISQRLKKDLLRQIRYNAKISKSFQSSIEYNESNTDNENPIPQSYIINSKLSRSSFLCSSSSSSLSKDFENDSNEAKTLLHIPKTFSGNTSKKRKKRNNLDSEMSDNEYEIVNKTRQMIRHKRWQVLKRRLFLNESLPHLLTEEWDESKEQNLVFSLL